MSPLLKNALESVSIGLTDLKEGAPERTVSSLRNVHAGILLLIKELLRQLSPPDSNEVLIKSRILPIRSADGNLSFVGDGKKTVDIQAMRERCESLQIDIDWNSLDKVTNARNQAEHYHPNTTPEVLQQILSDSFSLIHDILVNKLSLKPNEVLGEEEWAYLLENHNVHTAERERVEKSIDALDLPSSNLQTSLHDALCSECGSDLLEVEDSKVDAFDMVLVCRSCGKNHPLNELAPKILRDFHGYRMYRAVKDGGDLPLIECPMCNEETYEVEEGKCALCGESATQTCERCGADIPSSEIDDGDLCGYCSHMQSKIFAED